MTNEKKHQRTSCALTVLARASSRGDPPEDLKIASHVKTVEHLATFPPLDCDLAAGFVKLIAKERALAQQRLDAGHYLPGSLLALISKELGN